jgi:hypothetical protein
MSLLKLREGYKPVKKDDILYATERRMYSVWNLFPNDDKGKLKVYRKRISYNGARTEFNIGEIIRISMAKQTPNYGMHAVSFIVSFGVIFCTFMVMVYSLEYFLLFFVIILVLYPVSLFRVKLSWIKIEYLDNDRVKRAYFSDGSVEGLGRSFDRSSSLYESLNSIIGDEEKTV